MNTLEEYTDVVVVGAGHAGCEAALACVGAVKVLPTVTFFVISATLSTVFGPASDLR